MPLDDTGPFDRCSAAVHEPTASACFAPVYSAILVWNSWTRGPVPIQHVSIVRTTASISAWEITGLPKMM